jgi:hypothetical protein
MIEIPLEYIVIFGLIACGREAYAVFKQKQLRSIGTLFVFCYVTIIYILLLVGPTLNLNFHGSPFVRVGVLLIFLDKAIAFAYEVISRRRKWII